MGFSPIDIAEAIKWRSGNFDPIELRENTIAVARWNQRQFEIPDIIGFRDYLEQSSAVGNDPLVYPGAADTPGLLLSFPYPKTADTLRWLSIAGPDELILLRAAAGYVVRRTDPLLSSRVYSNRLDQRSHCWRFRDQKKAWSDFVKFGISLLDGRQYFAMYRTDIKSYYPSVDIGSVEALLAEHQCLVPAAGIVIRLFARMAVTRRSPRSADRPGGFSCHRQFSTTPR